MSGRVQGDRPFTGSISVLAAERMLLQVVEPGGALDVGQRLRAGNLLPFEDLAAADGPFELLHKLDHVMLDHPVQVDQLAVDIVDDFGLGW